MKYKQAPVAFAVFALSVFALTAQADNYNTGYNRSPNQPSNPYWQAPNRSGPNVPLERRQPYPAHNYNYPAQENRPPRPELPTQNQFRGDPPPPTGPYQSAPSGFNDSPSAFNTPGYNPNRNRNPGYNSNRDNRRNRNKFWGGSGPGSWMNPNKGNMERGWDDMINSPSRMGKMPGGWTAPEVTMPNPVDMGDQVQDNVKDLPEQIKNMDVGDNIK